MRTVWIGLWMVAAGVAAGAAAAEKPTIAVLEFKPMNASKGDAEAITLFVRNAVVRHDKFIVVEKAGIDKVLEEQAFQQTGCTEADCAVKLGRILNARKVIVGSYTVFEGSRLVSARIVDVETGQVEESATESEEERGQASTLDKLTYKDMR